MKTFFIYLFDKLYYPSQLVRKSNNTTTVQYFIWKILLVKFEIHEKTLVIFEFRIKIMSYIILIPKAFNKQHWVNSLENYPQHKLLT